MVLIGLLALPLVPVLSHAAAGPEAGTDAAPGQHGAQARQAGEASIPQLRAQISQARSQLKQTADGTKRNQLKRRIADLELELATQAQNPVPPARRALEAYHQLSRYQLIGTREADLLYQTAHASALAGRISAGIVALTRLIDKHPDYKLIPEAHFRRAELRFVYRSYAPAAEDYSWLIARKNKNLFYVQSLYKRGWARYKLGHYRDAMQDELAMLNLLLGNKAVAANGTLVDSGLSKAQQVLVNDALYNITLDFAALGDRFTPADFAQANGAARLEYVFTDNLMQYYRDKGRYQDTAHTARAFIERHPSHPQVQSLEVRAIAALSDGGLSDQALAAKQAYVRRYGVRGAQVSGKDALAVPAVRKRLAEYLDTITATLHAKAQDDGKPADYLEAAQWYATYLELFPKGPRAQELAALRGDALYDAHHYAEAARAYEQAAYDKPAQGRGADAAYSAVLAWRKAAGTQAGGDPQVKAATLKLARHYPAQADTAPALARLAEERFDLGQHAIARKLAEQVIELQPAAPEAELLKARRIRGAVALEDNDYAEAQDDYNWLLVHAPVADKPALYENLATAMYQHGAVFADAGHDGKALAQFKALRQAIPAHGGPASAIRATATYDAAAAAIRGGDKAEGARLLEALRSEYPDNEHAQTADQRLAALYSESGNNAQALQQYLQVRGDASASADVRREAALQVAKLYAEMGDTQPAITAYKRYYYDYDPAPADALEAGHALIGLYVSLGETDKANFWRKRIIANEPALGGKRSRTLAARAALALADQARSDYQSVQLHAPLKRQLARKKQRLQTALDAYGRAADYGIAEVTTAATYHTAVLYEDFSRALQDSPRPAGLDADQRARYNDLLQAQVAPFQHKAVAIYQANVARIADDGLYDQWIGKSLARLQQLEPARYARSEQLAQRLTADKPRKPKVKQASEQQSRQ